MVLNDIRMTTIRFVVTFPLIVCVALCLCANFTHSMRLSRASIEVQNKKLLSRTLANNIKETKRNEIQPIDHLATLSQGSFRINATKLPSTQFVASLYAKGSINTPWIYVRDRIFNHTEDFHPDYVHHNISYFHNVISNAVYGNRSFGFPRIMSELVEAQPVFQRVPLRSLILGFQLISSLDNTNDIFRIRRLNIHQTKASNIQSSISSQLQQSESTGNNQLTAELEKVLEDLNIHVLKNETKEYISHENYLKGLDAILRPLLTVKFSSHALSEIQVTSDGSVWVLPLNTCNNNNSDENNNSNSSTVSIGGGGVSVRLMFSPIDAQSSDDTNCKLHDKYLFSTSEMLKISNRAKKRATPRQLHKLKVKAIVAAHKQQKKLLQKQAQNPLLQMSEIIPSSVKEENLYFSLAPFVQDTAMTPLDAELAAGAMALTIIDHLILIKSQQDSDNSEDNQQIHDTNVRIVFQSDSKPIIRLFRSQVVKHNNTKISPFIKKQSKSPVNNRLFHSFLDRASRLHQGIRSLKTVCESRWVAGHPEKRHPLCLDWSPADWAVWQADWLSQQSLQHTIKYDNKSVFWPQEDSEEKSKVNDQQKHLLEEHKYKLNVVESILTKSMKIMNIGDIL